MSVREQQREKRRQEILVAGLDLFIRKGYASTKISDIAKQVGMSVGLLFHYFESKEALYKELITLGVSEPMKIVDDNNGEPIVFFENVAKQILQYLREATYTAKMFVLMKQAFQSEAAPSSVKELLAGFDVYTPTAVMIERGQANGTIRDGDSYALAIAFWCAIQGVAEQIALNPDTPCPESDWIVDIIRRKS